MIEHSIRAPDGRTLRVVEDGDPRGMPVFSLHGTPMSRSLYGPHVADSKKRGIRLIGYDRPGYGGSSAQPGRRVADAAHDVQAIADSIGLDRFAVWGISGGGPHSLACAALLPKRVVAASSLASPAPYPAQGLDWLEGYGEANIAEFQASLEGPDQLDAFLKPMRVEMIEATPEGLGQVLDSLLPPVDKKALTGDLAKFFADCTREGLKDGFEGWKEDDIAFVSDWGFRPSDISVPVLLWQGRYDRMVPFSHGAWLAKHMRGAETRLTQEDGHLTLYQHRIPETHEWLLSHF